MKQSRTCLDVASIVSLTILSFTGCRAKAMQRLSMESWRVSSVQKIHPPFFKPEQALSYGLQQERLRVTVESFLEQHDWPKGSFWEASCWYDSVKKTWELRLRSNFSVPEYGCWASYNDYGKFADQPQCRYDANK